MASVRSLVYRDTDMQKYLKDILIPLIGYRDAGHTWGYLRDQINKLQAEVKEMQIPEKSKFYNHGNFATPIFIYVPDNSYDYPENSMNEPIKVMIEFDYQHNLTPEEEADPDTEALSSGTVSFEVVIPGGASRDTAKVPYCGICNQLAYKLLDKIQVYYATDLRNGTEPNVYAITLPRVINKKDDEIFTNGTVTIYSENRNVHKADSWDGVSLLDPNLNIGQEYDTTQLGSVPCYDEVDEVERLVRSDTIREIVALTLPSLEYLQETGNTDPDTLYVGREDDDSTYDGRIFFETVEDFENELPTIYKIFGYNWHNLDIEFGELVTSIDSLLEGNTDIIGAPRAIIGPAIESAKNLFRNSSIKYIDNQEMLFAGMPNLKYLDSAFENTTITTSIVKDLIASNKNLVSIARMLANTNIYNTEELWNIDGMTDIYAKECYLNVDMSHWEAQGVHIFLSCPQYWLKPVSELDQDDRIIAFDTRDGFDKIKDYIIEDQEGDLSKWHFQFNSSEMNLEGIFEGTEVEVTPYSIMYQGTSLVGAFRNTKVLTTVTSTILSKAPNLTNMSEFLYNAVSVRSLPGSMTIPTNVNNMRSSFGGMTSVTGQAPTAGGTLIWQMAGQNGRPATIDGTNCFYMSPFANRGAIPKTWGGDGA